MNDNSTGQYVATAPSIFNGKQWGIINGKKGYYQAMFALVEFIRSVGYFRHPKLITKLKVQDKVLRFRVGVVKNLPISTHIEVLNVYDLLVKQLIQTLGEPVWVENSPEHLEWRIEPSNSSYVYAFLNRIGPPEQIAHFEKSPNAWLTVGLTNPWGVTYSPDEPKSITSSGIYRGVRLGKRIEGNWPPPLNVGPLLEKAQADIARELSGSAIQSAYAKAVEQTARELDAKLGAKAAEASIAKLSPLAQQMIKLEETWHNDIEAKIEKRVAEEVAKVLEGQRQKAKTLEAMILRQPSTIHQVALAVGLTEAEFEDLFNEASNVAASQPKGREAWKVTHHTADLSMLGWVRNTPTRLIGDEISKVAPINTVEVANADFLSGKLLVGDDGIVRSRYKTGENTFAYRSAKLGDLIQAYLQQHGTGEARIPLGDGKSIYIVRDSGEGTNVNGFNVTANGAVRAAIHHTSIDTLVKAYLAKGGRLSFGKLTLQYAPLSTAIVVSGTGSRGEHLEFGCNEAGEIWGRMTNQATTLWGDEPFNPSKLVVDKEGNVICGSHKTPMTELIREYFKHQKVLRLYSPAHPEAYFGLEYHPASNNLRIVRDDGIKCVIAAGDHGYLFDFDNFRVVAKLGQKPSISRFESGFDKAKRLGEEVSNFLNWRDGKHLEITNNKGQVVLDLWHSKEYLVAQPNDGHSRCVQISRSDSGDIETHIGGWRPE